MSINSTDYNNHLIQADSSTVLANSTIVLANGFDSTQGDYISGKLSIKTTTFTEQEAS